VTTRWFKTYSWNDLNEKKSIQFQCKLNSPRNDHQDVSFHHVLELWVIHFARSVRVRFAYELLNVDRESKILGWTRLMSHGIEQLCQHTLITSFNLSVDISPVLFGCPPKAINASIVSVSSLALAAVVFWFSITLRNSANSISPLLSSSTWEIIWKISSSVGFCPMAFSVAFNSRASICWAYTWREVNVMLNTCWSWPWRGIQEIRVLGHEPFRSHPCQTYWTLLCTHRFLPVITAWQCTSLRHDAAFFVWCWTLQSIRVSSLCHNAPENRQFLDESPDVRVSLDKPMRNVLKSYEGIRLWCDII